MTEEFYRDYDLLFAYFDMNGHLRHTAYSDYSTTVRVAYFESIGYKLTRFMQIGVSPVMIREYTEYKREIRLGDRIRVTMAMAGANTDASRWLIRHTIYRIADEKKPCCVITTEGGWINQEKRKLSNPPDEIIKDMLAMHRTADFKDMSSRYRLQIKE